MRYIAFFFQDSGDFDLQSRSGHIHFLVLSLNRVPDSGQHVCDRISHIRFLLPATLDYSGNLTGERQLPETNSAELKLLHKASRPSTALTTTVVAHGEFLFLC